MDVSLELLGENRPRYIGRALSYFCTILRSRNTWKTSLHDDVIKWKHLPRYWPFMRGIHRSPVNSPHKGQWRGALMFYLICAPINDWVNNRGWWFETPSGSLWPQSNGSFASPLFFVVAQSVKLVLRRHADKLAAYVIVTIEWIFDKTMLVC